MRVELLVVQLLGELVDGFMREIKVSGSLTPKLLPGSDLLRVEGRRRDLLQLLSRGDGLDMGRDPISSGISLGWLERLRVYAAVGGRH